MLKSITYCFLVCLSIASYSQNDSTRTRNIIQLTGVVFASDSNSVIPGAHVYVPAAGRGTTTNPYGFFSLPVLEGDSVILSSIGFKRSYYIVPEHKDHTSLKILLTLQEDITFLDEVSIFPYPTEAMFKQAVLSMGTTNDPEWLTSNYMKTGYNKLMPGYSESQAYYNQMQQYATHNKYAKPTNNLLNPWAWAKFIKTLKQGN